MARLGMKGKYFSIDNSAILVFGLLGVYDHSLVIRVDPLQVTPILNGPKATEDIMLLIARDVADQNIRRVESILVDNRTAVRLFMEGAVTAADFGSATESNMEINGSPTMAITLSGIIFKVGETEYRFRLVIVDEKSAGMVMATLGADQKVV